MTWRKKTGPKKPITVEARSPRWSEEAKDLVLAGVVVVLALVLLLANLGGRCLWQDEAQTALIARTVLTHGIPLGHDGKNSFSQDQGRDYGPGYVWLWHPWFPFYLLAGFFAVFGESTFVARLPFALFGAATVALTYVLAQLMWGRRRLSFITALLLATNVPFLILARQCRYYAPDMFFAVLALCGYWAVLKNRKCGPYTFVIGAVLLFHNHYVHCAALLAAVIFHAILFQRDRLPSVFGLSAVVGLVNLPWIIWFSRMRTELIISEELGDRTLRMAADFTRLITKHIFPPALLVVPPLLPLVSLSKHEKIALPDRESVRAVALILVFTAANVVALSLAGTYPFFRFLAPLIPVSNTLIALILDRAAAYLGKPVYVLMLAVIVGLPLSGRMTDYIYEITHEFRGPVDGIVRYLNKHAKAQDVVAITYDDLPVKFYTGLRVVGGLTGEDLTPAKTADWIIIRKYAVSPADLEVREFLLSGQVPLENYKPIRIPYPDVAFQNREDPDFHLFRTDTKERPVVILRKKK